MPFIEASKEPVVHIHSSFSNPIWAPNPPFVVMPCPPNSHRCPAASVQVTPPQRPPGPAPWPPLVSATRSTDSKLPISAVLMQVAQAVGLGFTTVLPSKVVIGALAGIQPPVAWSKSHISFKYPG